MVFTEYRAETLPRITLIGKPPSKRKTDASI